MPCLGGICPNNIIPVFTLSAVLTASTIFRSYIVPERNESFEACVVLEGLIERNVIINLSTADGSASGKLYCHKIEI